jgi:hypothetical protein
VSMYDAKVLTQKDGFDINLDISITSNLENMYWWDDDMIRVT